MKKKIIEHFKKADQVLYNVIEKVGLLGPTKTDNYFYDLCEIIINQQLSDKAASTIFSRFKKLFPREVISPEFLLKIPDHKVRSSGTSNAKVAFLKNLAKNVNNRTLNFKKLLDLEDRLVIQELTKVKGVGPWSAEMFLMFTLGREDVFSHGDLGLRNAIKKLYKFKKEPSKKQMEKIVKKWSPYRTYACRILWKTLEIG